MKSSKQSPANKPPTPVVRNAREIAEGTRGDSYVNFYYYLGHAINLWAHVDDSLFTVFRFALSSKDDTVAAIVFYGYNSISDRLFLTDRLFCLQPNSKRVSEWKNIKKYIDSLIPFRNRLAHDPSGRLVKIQMSEHESKVLFDGYKLYTADTKSLYKKRGPEILVPDMVDHWNKVKEAEDRLDAFIGRLPKRAQKPIEVSPRPKPPSSKAKTQSSGRTRQKP